MAVGTVAAVFTFALHAAIPLGIAAYSAFRERRMQRLAASPPLAPGRTCIKGAVEYSAGAEVALRVAITQHGREYKGKHSWHHVWTEHARSVTAVPFYVVDDGGTRTRVEPDEQTLLIDKITRTDRRDRTIRDVFAELAKGENVSVVGELVRGHDPAAGGYRDEGAALVMRPPRGDRLVVSTEPLGERFQREVDRYRIARKFFVAFTLVCALLDLGYLSRLLVGRDEMGTVTKTIAHTGKNSHCEIELALEGEKYVKADADWGWCSRPSLRGAKVPVIVVGEDHFAQLGSEPGIASVLLVMTGFALALFVFIYSSRTKPWYEGKAIDNEPGRL